MQTGIIKLKGKDYKTVAYRVNEFWNDHKEWSIQTEIINNNENFILMKCTILDEKNNIRGTGFAEEVKGSSLVNKTSAIENCETSAIGRGLSCIGFAGSEYASANELSEAIIAQERIKVSSEFIIYNDCVKDNIQTIYNIHSMISQGEIKKAAEAWFGLNDNVKSTLWKAPTKGGIFTTQQLEIMKSSEFRESYYGSPDDAQKT